MGGRTRIVTDISKFRGDWGIVRVIVVDEIGKVRKEIHTTFPCTLSKTTCMVSLPLNASANNNLKGSFCHKGHEKMGEGLGKKSLGPFATVPRRRVWPIVKCMVNVYKYSVGLALPPIWDRSEAIYGYSVAIVSFLRKTLTFCQEFLAFFYFFTKFSWVLDD